jgi:hypothetical protein
MAVPTLMSIAAAQLVRARLNLQRAPSQTELTQSMAQEGSSPSCRAKPPHGFHAAFTTRLTKNLSQSSCSLVGTKE